MTQSVPKEQLCLLIVVNWLKLELWGLLSVGAGKKAES